MHDRECPILIFVERFHFDVSHGHILDGVCVPEDHNELFLVHHCYNQDRQPLMHILQLSNVQHLVQLVPTFHTAVTGDITADTSLHLYDDFYLNSYFSKETFHAILSYQ